MPSLKISSLHFVIQEYYIDNIFSDPLTYFFFIYLNIFMIAALNSLSAKSTIWIYLEPFSIVYCEYGSYFLIFFAGLLIWGWKLGIINNTFWRFLVWILSMAPFPGKAVEFCAVISCSYSHEGWIVPRARKAQYRWEFLLDSLCLENFKVSLSSWVDLTFFLWSS